jgi:hypothetical protein
VVLLYIWKILGHAIAEILPKLVLNINQSGRFLKKMKITVFILASLLVYQTKFFEKRIEFKELNVIPCKYDMYYNLI